MKHLALILLCLLAGCADTIECGLDRYSESMWQRQFGTEKQHCKEAP